MSKCAVHMMKMKMSAMGGIQSHNQREHESKKNKEIDYSRSEHNYDLVLDEKINYHRAIKERIEELNLKKAVRKDAVVYSSFIVSAERDFFDRLGYEEYLHQENQRESVMYGLETPLDYDNYGFMDEKARNTYMEQGSKKFFQSATEFFCDRYGEENVINATVHLDESTPHMHLGIVPVTKDGRLSAKELFTPTELKSLQTDFAKVVGAKFGLERGQEGSQAKHLDEMAFKLKTRSEQLEQLEHEVGCLETQKYFLEKDNADLSKIVSEGIERVKSLEGDIKHLEEKKTALEGKIDALEGGEKNLLLNFLNLPRICEAWENFKKEWREELARRNREREERAAKQNERRESILGKLKSYEKDVIKEQPKQKKKILSHER